MRAFYRFLFFQGLKNWMQFLLSLIALTIVGEGLFRGSIQFLGLISIFSFFWFIHFVSYSTFVKNVNWMIFLPLSKSKLFLTHIFYILFLWLIFIPLMVVYLFIIIGAKKYGYSLELIGLFFEIIKMINFKTWGEIPFEVLIFFPLLFVVIYLNFFSNLKNFHAYSPAKVFNFSQFKIRSFISGYALTVGFCLPFFLWYYFSFFSFIVFSVFTMNYLYFYFVKNLYLFPESTKKYFFVGMLILSFLQLFPMTYYLVVGLKSEDLSSRVFFLNSLGRFSTHLVTQKEVSEIFTKPLSKSDFFKLSEFYRDHYHHGNKILKNQDPYLKLESFLSSNISGDQLNNLMHLFSLKEINLKDLKFILSTATGQIRKDDFIEFIIQFYTIKITKDELIELLQDEDEYVSRYALYRSHYDRYPELIPVIEKRLNNLSKHNQSLALNSLSLLLGKKLGLDEWVSFKNGMSFSENADFFKPDCDKLKKIKFDSLTNFDFPYLPVCLRMMVNREDLFLLKQIEFKTWDNFPLDSSEIKLVKRIIHQESGLKI